MKSVSVGFAAIVLMSATATVIGASQHTGPTTRAPYAGQQARAVSTLSSGDITDLEAGRGWGLAKPAELNGFPGPRHILDLANALSLSSSQRQSVSAIYERMNARAKVLGRDLIAAERALDDAFRSGAIDEARLRHLVDAAESVRRDLRIVHLDAHLQATPVLTMHQRHRYNQLRGYDPASSNGDHKKHRH